MKSQKLFSRAFVLIMIVSIFLTRELKAQEEEEKNPKIEIKVNKERDENGNIIYFDSTYSYSWKGGDFTLEYIDSIFQNFGMRQGLGDFFNPSFFKDELFKTDSLLQDFMNPFNKNDFFGKHRIDSLPAGIYDDFFGSPFRDYSSFDKMQEMMEKYHEKMMKHFKQFRNFQDSTFKNKPIMKKQESRNQIKKNRLIKT